MSLIKQLVEEKIIDQTKATALEFEAKRVGKTEEEIILEKGIVPEEHLFKLKSKGLKIPLKKITPEEVPLEVLELIPEEPAVYYKMIPIAKKDNVVEVGMIYPEDVRSQEALRFLSRQGKFKTKISLIVPSDFNNLLKQHRTLRKEAEKALDALEKERGGAPIPDLIIEEDRTITKEIAEEAPIIKMVSVILRHAIEGRASDIHIEPQKNRLKVRFRLDGILHASLFLPLRVHPAIIARIKILSNLKIDETRIPQDGRFSSRVDTKEIDFRVSTLPTLYGEKAAIRVLDPGVGVKSYTQLGLRGRSLKIAEGALKKPYGMILATGPTGSGKTTTLYALLRTLNKEGVNIITIEDPVEYSIEGINQSQVKPEIGYGFAQGLRHILRQDPDIIMVGEVRDEETASLVIHAALTGHTVLSTLHTNNSIGVIPRFIDMGVKPFLIPAALNIAIAQRLVRNLCPYCKKKVKPEQKILDYILEKIDKLPPLVKNEAKIPKTIYIYEPQGCEKCNFKGFTGRSGLFEVLSVTENLTEIILKEPTEAAIMEEARNQGMLTMLQDGVLKALDGETTIEEVISTAEEK